MPERSADRLAQAEPDLAAAEQLRVTGYFEWAAFVAQQGGEKALKAVFQVRHGNVRGYSLLELAQLLQDPALPQEVLDAARRLDRYYIQTRYPDSFAAGIPQDYFTAEDAASALTDAGTITRWSQSQVS